MTKIHSEILIGATTLMLGVMLAAPLASFALSRTEARFDAALLRQATTEQQSGTGGTAGSNGGTSGGNGATSETDNTNVSEEEGQALLDELIASGGPDTGALPVDPELDQAEVEGEVKNIDTSSVGSDFITILKSVFSRFANR